MKLWDVAALNRLRLGAAVTLVLLAVIVALAGLVLGGFATSGPFGFGLAHPGTVFFIGFFGGGAVMLGGAAGRLAGYEVPRGPWLVSGVLFAAASVSALVLVRLGQGKVAHVAVAGALALWSFSLGLAKRTPVR
jgi:hypothetical protein